MPSSRPRAGACAGCRSARTVSCPRREPAAKAGGTGSTPSDSTATAEDSPSAAVASRPYLPAGWRLLRPAARGLIVARGLRSIAQGALAAEFVLYLHALGWTAGAIGLVLGAASLAGGVLGLAVGPISDRHGRRTFLLIYEGALAACTVAVLARPYGPVLVGAAVLFGFGQGANGGAGPFAPAEQAWLAQVVPAATRGATFSLNAAAGFWGMGVGALLGAAVPLWAPRLPGTAAYTPLFALTLVIALINLWQITRLGESPEAPPRPEANGAATDGATTGLQQRENRALALLVTVNAVNSLGIGLFGPLLPYWLAVRFGAGPAAVGSLYAVTFLLTGVASIATGELTGRYGLVGSIVGLRLVSTALLASMPLCPTLGLAAAAYVGRSVISRGSAGARQAFGVGLVRDRRRGLASSLNSVSWSLPAAIGPALAGRLMAWGSLALPFYLASVLQLAYAVLFFTMLRPYEPGGTHRARRTPA